MRLLDLFCGAGGAAVGYSRAGFDDITGIDINPQPRYPFKIIQADAMGYASAHGHEYDVIHASPPCQAYSTTAALSNADHPKLVPATRSLLRKIGRPYVIENVPGAPMEDALMLCGTMFGLDVIRHRLFECSWGLVFPPFSCCHAGKSTGCAHARKKLGVTRAISQRDGYRFVTVFGNGYLADEGRAAMGIKWMTMRELSQAIPPAYTEWIGKQFIQQLACER